MLIVVRNQPASSKIQSDALEVARIDGLIMAVVRVGCPSSGWSRPAG